MQPAADIQLERLVKAVNSSVKYRYVCPDLVRRIGAQELADHAKLPEAIKATKNKLHQVGGAYLDRVLPYQRWLDSLANLPHQPSQEDFKQRCLEVMRFHASTRERLPILDEFYRKIFDALPPLRSVLDIACGLNPLALPWMPLPKKAAYLGFEIYSDMVDFLNRFLAGYRGTFHAEVRDVLADDPYPAADLALLLKTIPCLEQVDKSAGLRLLEGIPARFLVVSFPGHSLGGRSKGMPATYTTRFQALIAEKTWAIQRFDFPSEVAFLVDKQGQFA